MKRIGIVGGTFDPVHLGHIMMALSLKEAHKLDHLLFLPVGENPHKKGQKTAPKRDRLNMLKLALKGIPDVSIETCDLEYEGVSYMVDTLRYLKKKYGDAKLYLLIGQDLVDQFEAWKEPHEIRKLATLLVARRAGGSAVKGVTQTPLFDVSATDVRKRLQEGRELHHLLDKTVLKYIQKNGVYEHSKKAK